MKIVKFKKDHVAGFAKGDVREIENGLADRLKKEGYTESATKKELDKSIEELSNRKPANTYDENLANTNNSNDCEDCGGENKNIVDEVKYHILTQEDIDANAEAAKDFKVGDEVQENADGDLILSDENVFIGRPEGNE